MYNTHMHTYDITWLNTNNPIRRGRGGPPTSTAAAKTMHICLLEEAGEGPPIVAGEPLGAPSVEEPRVRNPGYEAFIKFLMPVFLPGTFRESSRVLFVSSTDLHKRLLQKALR